METVLRIAFFYLFILGGLRVLGKREFSEFSPFELVTLLLIPELASQALLREDFSATNAVVALSTLFALVFLTSLAVHKSRRAGDVIGGSPTVLVHEGRFVRENLNRERITPEEVYGEMRMVGLERVEQVRWAILEGDGRISFVPERQGEELRRPQSNNPAE
jgi:uncharacterized membrane protein YcaP (DUF421 family)